MNFSRINEMFDRNTQKTNKWFNEVGSTLMDVYSKQLNLAFGLYNNLFTTQFEALREQMVKFNTNWVTTLQKQFQDVQNNWGELSGKSQEIIEEKWGTTSNIITSMIEAYNKQMNFSVESNKKLMEEINSQLNLVTKQNEKFWADILKTIEASEETENTQGQSKKQNKTEHATSNI